MSESDKRDALAKARRSYEMNRKQWDFLGYSEAVALAVLTEFFEMPKVKNPSQKPLNILSMVGKSRIRAIKEAVTATLAPADAGEDDAGAETPMPDAPLSDE